MGLRYQVKRFKSAQMALKELEPFVRDARHLQSGKPFARFGGMLPREALANWLICAAVNVSEPERLSFTSDPVDGDGVIIDQKSGRTWPTEHVMVTRRDAGPPIEDLIHERIQKKRDKGGEAYASGKTLIVFLDVDGAPWYPNRVARTLPQPLWFDGVWVAGLDRATDNYIYNIACVDPTAGNAPVWRVHIAPDFSCWTVEAVQ